MLANPLQDLLKRTIVGFKHSNNELFTFVGGKNQLPPVQAQENVSREERHSFVAVHERMVDQKGFEHCCCHLFDMCVVTGLRSEEGAFEKAAVTYSVVAAKTIDQALLNSEYLIE